MNDYAYHAQGLGYLQTRLADSCPVVTWGNEDYIAIPSTAIRRGDLSQGGIQLNADLKFEALVAQFLTDTIKNAGDLRTAMLLTRISYLGDTYKIDSVHIRPGGFQVGVECTAEGQKA